MNNKILKSADLKTTKKRQIIIGILEKAQAPMTAEDIYRDTISEIHMSVSTIYRTLGTMAEKGILIKHLSQDGKIYYQFNNHLHKHTIICTLCNAVIPIDDCPLEKLEENLAKKTGFIITGHNLEFTGICPECAKCRKIEPKKSEQ